MLDEQILEREEMLNNAKTLLENFEKQALVNVENFHKQKTTDIADILMTYIIMTIDRCKKSKATWVNIKEACDAMQNSEHGKHGHRLGHCLLKASLITSAGEFSTGRCLGPLPHNSICVEVVAVFTVKKISCYSGLIFPKFHSIHEKQSAHLAKFGLLRMGRYVSVSNPY